MSKSADALGPLCRRRSLWLLPLRLGVLHAGSLSRVTLNLCTNRTRIFVAAEALGLLC